MSYNKSELNINTSLTSQVPNFQLPREIPRKNVEYGANGEPEVYCCDCYETRLFDARRNKNISTDESKITGCRGRAWRHEMLLRKDQNGYLFSHSRENGGNLDYILCQQNDCNTIVPRQKAAIIYHNVNEHLKETRAKMGFNDLVEPFEIQSELFKRDALFYNNRSMQWTLENPLKNRPNTLRPRPKDDINRPRSESIISTKEYLPTETVYRQPNVSPPTVSWKNMCLSNDKHRSKYVSQHEVVKDTPIQVAEETPIQIVEETMIQIVEETPIQIAEETPIQIVEETPIQVAEETSIQSVIIMVPDHNTEEEFVRPKKSIRAPLYQKVADSDIFLERFCRNGPMCPRKGYKEGELPCCYNHTTALDFIAKGSIIPVNFCKWEDPKSKKRCLNKKCIHDHMRGRSKWIEKEQTHDESFYIKPVVSEEVVQLQKELATIKELLSNLEIK